MVSSKQTTDRKKEPPAGGPTAPRSGSYGYDPKASDPERSKPDPERSTEADNRKGGYGAG